ncbi:MAG: hypothetical protein ACTSYA_12095, partial [Candidatus Kariarchaeaceae archaeon]
MKKRQKNLLLIKILLFSVLFSTTNLAANNNLEILSFNSSKSSEPFLLEASEPYEFGEVLLSENFSTDVFDGSTDWSKETDSIYVNTTSQCLHFEPDGTNYDRASHPINWSIPFIVEVRGRVVSGGYDNTIAAITLLTSGASTYFGYSNYYNRWLFDNQYYDGYGPSSENQWWSYRAVISSNFQMLYSKNDSDAEWTSVANATRYISSNFTKVSVAAPYDSNMDVDYITFWKYKAPNDELRIFSTPNDNYFFYEGTTGHTLTWIASDQNPDRYLIYQEGIVIQNDTWEDDEPVSISLNGLIEGNYNFSIKFTNDEGAFVTDSLIVKVGSVIVGEYGSEIT